MNADRKMPPKAFLIGTSMLILALVAFVVVLAKTAPNASEKQARAMRHMAWCHDSGGVYPNKIASKDHDGAPRFVGAKGTCEIPPASVPEDCYTTEQDAPMGAPVGVNWYAYYLLDKSGAGGLDEYEHCAEFAVTRPRATEP